MIRANALNGLIQIEAAAGVPADALDQTLNILASYWPDGIDGVAVRRPVTILTSLTLPDGRRLVKAKIGDDHVQDLFS